MPELIQLETHHVLMCANRADEATFITYKYAEYVKGIADDLGIPYVFLGMDDANPDRVHAELEKNPSGFFHWDHGNFGNIFGQLKGEIVSIVSVLIAHVLKGTITSTCSCQSAANLGPAAIREGARAYEGYKEIAYVRDDDQTKRVMNTAKVELLKGKTIGEAYKAQYDAYGQPSDCGVSKLIAIMFGVDFLNALRNLRSIITGRPRNVVLDWMYEWNQSHYVLVAGSDPEAVL